MSRAILSIVSFGFIKRKFTSSLFSKLSKKNKQHTLWGCNICNQIQNMEEGVQKHSDLTREFNLVNIFIHYYIFNNNKITRNISRIRRYWSLSFTTCVFLISCLKVKKRDCFPWWCYNTNRTSKLIFLIKRLGDWRCQICRWVIREVYFHKLRPKFQYRNIIKI